MKLYTKLLCATAALMNAALPSVALASATIAHRGLFHDVADSQALPENSYDSINRAYGLGMSGVELDVRTDENNDVVVTHDFITNRTTTIDNLQGGMNPVSQTDGSQPPVRANNLSATSTHDLATTKLKIYGRNAQLIGSASQTGVGAGLLTLNSLLFKLQANYQDIFANPGFLIILDVQDPFILRAVGQTIHDFRLENKVYVKFFASKALYNQRAFTYNGSDTCYVYQKNNNMLGLNIIPQINDGELDIDENDDAGINAFQTRLSIPQYLDCWAGAQAAHPDAARMPIVSASVPANESAATAGANAAITWARSHGRKTMTIVPNPDAGRRSGGVCKPYQFASSSVRADSFNLNRRAAKQAFAARINPDYIIYDVMGDYIHNKYYNDYQTFSANLC